MLCKSTVDEQIGQCIELHIEKIAAGGEGLGRFDGKSVFVALTAPGDTVRCRITEDHSSWARAELLEVVNPSSDRVTPLCPHYGLCGGCDLQHINYTAQIREKTVILTDAFKRIGRMSVPQPEVFTSKTVDYRNRMQLHCIKQFHCDTQPHSDRQLQNDTQKNGAQTGLGLKARKSNDIIPVSDCVIAHPVIRNFLKNVNQGKFEIEQSKQKQRFTVYGNNTQFLYEGGQEQGKINILGKEILINASVFFQSNAQMLENMILELKKIVAEIPGKNNEQKMADLYCGVGTFACFLAEYFNHIDLMEMNGAALSLAKENCTSIKKKAAANSRKPDNDFTVNYFNIKDCDWIKLHLVDYSFAVVDPPRQGLALSLSRWLCDSGPPVLVYVSCAPATLARDSALLTTGGYCLKKLQLHDIYPHTSHSESLAMFVR